MVLTEDDYFNNIRYYKFFQKKQKWLNSIIFPLKYISIDVFLYLKLISEQKYQVMCTDDNFVQQVLFSSRGFGKYIRKNLMQTKTGKLHTVPINDSGKNDFVLLISKDKLKFSGLAFFMKLAAFSEIFIFLQYKNYLEIIQNNLENIKLLKRFMSYFREKLQKLLNPIKDAPYALFLTKSGYNSKIRKEKTLLSLHMPSNSFSFQVGDKDIVLSKRESIYLYLMSLGNNGAIIAKLMGISFKRSNDILLNIKKKTNKYSKASLIELIRSF